MQGDHAFNDLSFPVAERILWAGEATSPPFVGDTHGALLSGRREAERLIFEYELLPPYVGSGNAAAYVQLSSSPSEADAQASLRALNNRYGSLFGGNQLVIQSADLGQKGVWYRVKLPAASVADAQNMCASIKANGGDCIVNR